MRSINFSSQSGKIRSVILLALIYQVLDVSYFCLSILGIFEENMIYREMIEFVVDFSIKCALMYGLWRHIPWVWKLTTIYISFSFPYIVASMYFNPRYESPEIYLCVVAIIYGFIVLSLNSGETRSVFGVYEFGKRYIPYMYNFLFTASIFLLGTYSIGYIMSFFIAIFVYITLMRANREP